MPSAFELERDGKILSYIEPGNLRSEDLTKYFEHQGYTVESVQLFVRHAIIKLAKGAQSFCAKIATSEGTGVLTAQEVTWNEQVEKILPVDAVFTVPHVVEHGKIANTFVYHVTQWVDAPVLIPFSTENNQRSSGTLSQYVAQIVTMTKQIEKLPLTLSVPDESLDTKSPNDIFLEKTLRWLATVPDSVQVQFALSNIVEELSCTVPTLRQAVRHGDVTPWHMALLSNGKLMLFDGEHAHSKAVSGYDLAYCIQRFFSIVHDEKVSQELLNEGMRQGYTVDTLRPNLLARAIGGFCDEARDSHPDFTVHAKFIDWINAL